jgi:uncharacterized OB-fold protein
MVQRCDACGAYQHYPRPLCRHCMSERLGWAQASGGGTIHTFTITYRNDTPAFAEQVPYVFAIVDLEPEGVRMTGNVLTSNPEQLRIGDAVRVTFVAVTDEISLPQWLRSVESPPGE